MTKAAVLGVVEKAGVVAMLSRPIDITFEDDGLHIVVQQVPGHTAEGDEGVLVAFDQSPDLHVADEFDVAGPAVSERGAEGVERDRLPLRNSTQSTCICSPGSVSNRTTGSTGSVGLTPRRNRRNWLMPPW
jgi:hypothetical protein